MAFDIDGDGRLELVVGTRNRLHAVEADGNPVSGFPLEMKKGSGIMTPVSVGHLGQEKIPAILFGSEDRKLVVLCIANQRTPHAQAALQGARDFRADARFASATEVVTLDPDDPAETGFLRQLQVDPRSPQATTVLLAPPGQPVARLSGAVTKDQLVARLVSAQSNPCAGGKCGPGGCGPRK